MGCWYKFSQLPPYADKLERRRNTEISHIAPPLSPTLPLLHLIQNKLCTSSRFCSLGKYYEFGVPHHHTAQSSVTSKRKQCPRCSGTKIKMHWQPVWFLMKVSENSSYTSPCSAPLVHPLLKLSLPRQCLHKETCCLNYWNSNLCPALFC